MKTPKASPAARLFKGRRGFRCRTGRRRLIGGRAARPRLNPNPRQPRKRWPRTGGQRRRPLLRAISKETYDADVIVVGLGHAGIAASRAAVESGASVITLENRMKIFSAFWATISVT